MQTISFYVNSAKSGAAETRDRLAELSVKCGMRIAGEGETPDAVVALGGDGTVLTAVHQYPGVPILGLNLGSLGYLATVDESRFETAIGALARGEYRIAKRAALKVKGTNALNDVVIARGGVGHVLRLKLSVDGREVTRFTADGIVIATPTGSTAYSLSAGGPILMPDSLSIAITPVCPHSLASRPLVLSDTARIAVTPELRDDDEAVLFADGRRLAEIADGEEVTIGKSDITVPFIEIGDVNPFEVMKRKLGWGGTALK